MAAVLIVDDSKFMRKVIRDTLEEAGHEIVAEADNGIDGVEMYKTHHPEIVTMDVTMAGMDGVGAVDQIMAFDPDARIIVVSALNEKTIKIKNQNVPARTFINKPFTKEELLSAVDLVSG